MQIVQSTFIVLALIVMLMARGPNKGLVILMALTPMGMLAAVNLPAVGGTTILGIDLAVIVLFAMLCLRRQGVNRLVQNLGPDTPGLFLVLFLLYACIATLFFPRVFAGETDVFGLGRVANQIGIVIRPLGPSSGNLAQLMRIILSAMAFGAVVTLMRWRPDTSIALRAMIVATLVHVTFGIVDLGTNATNTSWLLEPVRTANYTLTLGQKMAGLNRMIGGFPEASAYGYFTLGMFGFWLSYWFYDRSNWWLPNFFLLLSTVILLRGTSSSAYVGAGAVVFVFASTQILQARRATMSKRISKISLVLIALLPILLIGSFILYELVPGITDFIDRTLFNKLTSDSGEERMSWNRQAWQNFLDTYLLGAGLGAVRASNWVISCLATTGIVGTAFMLIFVARVLRVPSYANQPGLSEVTHMIVALKFGCLGFIMRALVTKATPNLEIVFFIMAGMAVGLSYAHRKSVAQPPILANLAVGIPKETSH